MQHLSFMEQAEQYCRVNKQRFTQSRSQVLQVLFLSNNAMGAYAILNALSTREHTLKPPTVYRAIDFWVEHGFVHKVESLNAYIVCGHCNRPHQTLMMICENCHTAKESCLTRMPRAVDQALASEGFQARKSIFEVLGLCDACQGQGVA